MACFIAPAGVALVTTVARKIVEKRENDPSAHGAERRPDPVFRAAASRDYTSGIVCPPRPRGGRKAVCCRGR